MHLHDPLRFARRSSAILDDPSIDTLAKTPPMVFKSSGDVVSILNQNKEWEDTWASKIFDIIMLYDPSISGHASATMMESDVEEESSDDEPLMKRFRSM